jgi:hypothetical protein
MMNTMVSRVAWVIRGVGVGWSGGAIPTVVSCRMRVGIVVVKASRGGGGGGGGGRWVARVAE